MVLIQFSSVVSDSLWPHGLQHTRPPCPSPTLGVYSNSRPLSRWCHPAISSSVSPFSCLKSFPASGSFPRSQFFASGGWSIGVSASSRGSWVPLHFLPLKGIIFISEVAVISPRILIPACESSSPTFHMIYSAYKLISRVTIYINKNPKIKICQEKLWS